MQRVLLKQAQTPVLRSVLFSALLFIATPAFSAPDIPDFSSVTPGPCITRDPAMRENWINAHTLIRARDYPSAMAILSPMISACPDDASARHLAALCAWGIGQRALATRWLVQAARQRDAEPATAVALAALNAEAATESVAIGWLRRALEPLDLYTRAFWVTRPSFNRLWSSASEPWRAFIQEMGLPADLTVVRAMGVPPIVHVEAPQEDEQKPTILRLSPFDPNMDSMDRAIQMRIAVTRRLIERIRPSVDIPPEIPLQEEESLVNIDDVLSEQP